MLVNETASWTEIGNTAQQTFSKTETGTGDYIRTDTGPGATLGSLDSIGGYSYHLAESGNWHAGSASQSETGTDRYGLLEVFDKVASSSNDVPGHLDFSPFGAAFTDPPPEEDERRLDRLSGLGSSQIVQPMPNEQQPELLDMPREEQPEQKGRPAQRGDNTEEQAKPGSSTPQGKGNGNGGQGTREGLEGSTGSGGNAYPINGTKNTGRTGRQRRIEWASGRRQRACGER